MLAFQILIDGFAISALYALGATGFTLMFGVSGVLNLSHGSIMVAAAVAAWVIAGDLAGGAYLGARGGGRLRPRRRLCDLLHRGAADPALQGDPQGGDRDLRAHRHPAVGHHDPGSDRL